MSTIGKILIAALGVAIFSPATLAADSEKTARKIVPVDRQFAELAGRLQYSGRNLDQIFAEMCRKVLSNVDANPSLRLDDQVRAMFGGLWLWTRKGGVPVLQGRHDWALHFIGGGAFEGYWDVGRSAALIKERIDARDSANVFDLDDMAATILGARWIDIAVNSDAPEGRRWVELWATGRYTLSGSLPRLDYGRMPRGEVASPELIQAIRSGVEQHLTSLKDAKK